MFRADTKPQTALPATYARHVPSTERSSQQHSLIGLEAKSSSRRHIRHVHSSIPTVDEHAFNMNLFPSPLKQMVLQGAHPAQSNISERMQFPLTMDELKADDFVSPGYDKLMPPKENGKPTVVRFHVWVLGLDSIDEGSMTYVADIFMSQSWKDNRLLIPPNINFNVNASANPHGPYRLLPLALIDKIWRPDSFFKNAKEVTFQEMTVPNHYIWLYSDHTILYMVKLSLLLSCAMKFQAYPHDTQNCTMKIESLSYTANDLVFDWEESDPLVVEEHIELPQHDLVNQQIDHCTTNYSSGVFTCVQVTFTIKRRLGYYIFHTYIPTCLIVIMSWISFWIKPEAVPARVTLCVTSLLTLSTQHAQSQKSLPPVSYIKAIDIFMSSCTLFVFASLMEYALVNILMSDELVDGWIGIPTPAAYIPPNKEQRTIHNQSIKSSNSPLEKPKSDPLCQTMNIADVTTNLNRKPCLTQKTKIHNAVMRVHKQGRIHGYRKAMSNRNIKHRSKFRPENSSKNARKQKVCKTSEKFIHQTKVNYGAISEQNRKNFHHSKLNIHTRKLQKKHHRAYVVDNVSRWIFPLSFVLLNIVYWAYYLEMAESIENFFNELNF